MIRKYQLDDPEMKSKDLVAENIEAMKSLFPSAFADGKIDFAVLRELLGDVVEDSAERYGLSWPGKRNARLHAFAPSLGTLRPIKSDGIAWDSAEHLLIEGDNLEVLKVIQKSYAGKIRVIYIDPPYNTGKDLVYVDDYTESLASYLKYSGQLDARGQRLTNNSESDGRYHSKWLSMMYPRLMLARDLLQDDGLLFVSIDRHEDDNLRKICGELFGEENLVAWIANVNNPKGRSDDKYVATAHESLAIYKKREASLGGWEPEEKITKRYNKVASGGVPYREIDLRKTGDADRRIDRPNMFYFFLYNELSRELRVTRDVAVPEGWIQIRPMKDDGSDGRWRWALETSADRLSRLVAKFMPVRQRWGVFEMDLLDEDERIKPTSVWSMKEVNSERGSEQFIELGFDKEIFPRPKPVGLIRRILDIATSDGDTILDFFGGSGVTAQAVLEANAADGKRRKFILVQLPEPTRSARPDGSFAETAAWAAGYATIAEVTKERVRRALGRVNTSENGDRREGFRVYRLADSNLVPWATSQGSDSDSIAAQLRMNVERIRPDRSDDDLATEILLKLGFELTAPCEVRTVAGKTVRAYSGVLYLCFDAFTDADVDAFVDGLGTLHHEVTGGHPTPSTVIFRDDMLGKDSVKTNLGTGLEHRGLGTIRSL